MRISSLSTDPVKEKEGVWVPLGDGLRIKVARIGNPKYENFMRTAGRAQQRAVRYSQNSPEVVHELVKQGVAAFCLLDWENLEEEVRDAQGNIVYTDKIGADGLPVPELKPIPFSREKALELFNTTPEFFRIVLECVSDVSLFRKEDAGTSAKN